MASQPDLLLIKPPPAVRAVLEKTAAFVAKNGRAFETRILNSDKGSTAKFAFLHATSPFHAYYEERVRLGELGQLEEEGKEKEDNKGKDGKGGEDDNKGEGADGGAKDGAKDGGGKENDNAADVGAAATKARVQRPSAPDPAARALLVQRQAVQSAAQAAKAAADKSQRDGDGGDSTTSTDNASEPPQPALRPPPALVHTALVAPSHLSAVQIEVIQLAAQYAALDSLSNHNNNTKSVGGGKPNRPKASFVKILTEREWTSAGSSSSTSTSGGGTGGGVFGFVQSRDPAHAYFTALVDAYRALLEEDAVEQSDGKKKGGDAAAKAKGEGGHTIVRDLIIACSCL